MWNAPYYAEPGAAALVIDPHEDHAYPGSAAFPAAGTLDAHWVISVPGQAKSPKHTKTECHVSKRTFQPNNRRRAKTHGFRLRIRTRAGRAIIANRRAKGRDRLSA